MRGAHGAMTLSWTETDDLPLPAGAVAPMQQHPTYGATCAALGTGVRRFALRSGARTLGTAQVLVRPWPLLGASALLSRGPVWAPDLPPGLRREGLVALLDGLRADHRAVTVTPDPVAGADPLAGRGWLPMVTPASLAELDLVPDPDRLRAGLRGKWRNGLCRAERAGLAVRETAFPDDPGHWLLAAEVAQARARRYRRLPPAFALAWVRAGGAGGARLFTARRGRGAPVAAMLFLLHGGAASYHIGWSGAEGRATGAHALLMWQAMTRLAARGIRVLDLGNLETDASPGLARFKLGTGARPVTLGATRLSAPGTRLFLGAADRRPGVLPVRWQRPAAAASADAPPGVPTAGRLSPRAEAA